MAEVEMQWYVLRAVSGKEAKVKEYIDAEINRKTPNGCKSKQSIKRFLSITIHIVC